LSDALHARFAATAARLADHQELRAEATRARLRRLLAPDGEEVALDVGTGTGALAIALAPLVGSVVGVDIVPELLAEARRRSPPELRYLLADATRLPFPAASFSLVSSARTLHHLAAPARVLAEMARVLRPGGTMLVIDELAAADPAQAAARERFERARDPSTTHILAEAELNDAFARLGLRLRSYERTSEPRELEPYLDLAGCVGPAREHARALAPADLDAQVGWFVLERPSGA
jgi:ubiquinone/menaquinone biosynthesis C-methylase UbiE